MNVHSSQFSHFYLRWKIVIRGGIDGFSRLIVFLKASSNNKEATVQESFLAAIDEHCWPSRIRIDKGKKNVKVQECVNNKWGATDESGRLPHCP